MAAVAVAEERKVLVVLRSLVDVDDADSAHHSSPTPPSRTPLSYRRFRRLTPPAYSVLSISSASSALPLLIASPARPRLQASPRPRTSTHSRSSDLSRRLYTPPSSPRHPTPASANTRTPRICASHPSHSFSNTWTAARSCCCCCYCYYYCSWWCCCFRIDC